MVKGFEYGTHEDAAGVVEGVEIASGVDSMTDVELCDHVFQSHSD